MKSKINTTPGWQGPTKAPCSKAADSLSLLLGGFRRQRRVLVKGVFTASQLQVMSIALRDRAVSEVSLNTVNGRKYLGRSHLGSSARSQSGGELAWCLA